MKTVENWMCHDYIGKQVRFALVVLTSSNKKFAMENEQYSINNLFLSTLSKRFLDVPGTKILILNGKELLMKIKRRINDEDVPKICDFLNENPKVVSINLAYNQITSKGMTHIVHFLKENTSLLELNLMNNDITEAGIVSLDSLKTELHLQSLRLNGNKIGPKGLKSLALMLSTNQSLMNLDVGETDQNIESLVYFTTVLRTANFSLQSVNLSRILGPPSHVLQTDVVAQVIQQTLTVNKSIRELHLQKIGFLCHDVELLVEGLKKNSSIMLLDLSCNNIGDFGIQFLAEFIGTKPPLETLLVSNNNIGDTGARSLSFKFPYSKILYLDISRNKLTDRGLLDILNCLKKEVPLKGLFIRGNQIGRTTCKVLFRMILSGVLSDEMLDINVYCDQNQGGLAFSSTESVDHVKPHYYCLCARTELPICQPSDVMKIRNKML